MNKIKSIITSVTTTIRKAVVVKIKALDVEERAIAYIAEWFEPLVTW